MTTTDLGRRVESLLGQLATRTDDASGRLTRLFLSPAHRAAADDVAAWMAVAGLDVTIDALATVRGVLPAGQSGPLARRRLLVGSHIDTVVDAGRYDGMLGVVAGLVAIEEMRTRGVHLPFALELLAFGDEEGVRFPTTLASSSAVAGTLAASAFEACDADGVSLADALRAFGCAPERLDTVALARDDAVAYLEVHIEQGPVLENEGLPLGVVTSIAGQSRFNIEVTGFAGHAGTVPMAMRRDALAAAAAMMSAIEAEARRGKAHQMVATVGRLTVEPGAVNVIPKAVRFTLDIRAASDAPRLDAIAAIERECGRIAAERGVGFSMSRYHDSPTTPCAASLQDAFAEAVASLELPVRHLTSGAGHDGQAMHKLTDIGMLFVRCRGGISHNPAESASVEDMGLAVEALIRAIGTIAARMGTSAS